MLEREIKIGGVYRHVKGTLHEVIGVAKDSETLEEKVVYNHVDTPQLWIRNKNEFLSEVDHEKYPDVEQKFRFELIES